MKKVLTTVLTLMLALNAATLAAETAEEKGLAIATKAKQLDTGWKDQLARMRMVLRNRRGQEFIREIRNKTMEVKNDGDKSLIVFDLPRDIKGTAFLSHTHIIKADDQWLYLKSLKRVKRISTSNKSGSFMGSEFSYEDISSQEIDKYSYKYLGDDKVKEKAVFKIEQRPTYRYSGYRKVLVWIDKKNYRPLKMEFYDRKDSLLKTLTYHGYKQYKNKFWRPAKMHMVNHQTGKTTTLNWSEYKFDNNLTSSDFDISALKRAR